MELIATLWDLVVHLDAHLAALMEQFGPWIYVILFLIIFCETGLVVTPFLPGDSLLFVAGALAAKEGGMDIGVLATVLIVAAVLGDNTNYWIGRYVGPRVFRWENSRFFNRAAFDKTHDFYERHGGKTVVIARFLPLLRTFAPFVAGVARMTYPRFFVIDFFGGCLWILSMTLAGYVFGNLPVVKNNLSLLIIAIIGVSLIPAAVAYLRARAQSKA